VIDATIGGASSNSFVDLAYADAYFLSTLSAVRWAALTVKNEALVSGTLYLDTLGYKGTVATDTQALQFPRLGSAVIPERIKIATCGLALYMAENQDAFGVADMTTEIKVAVIQIKQEVAAIGSISSLPLGIKNLIREFLDDGEGSLTLVLQ
jgi:hypothetical protein